MEVKKTLIEQAVQVFFTLRVSAAITALTLDGRRHNAGKQGQHLQWPRRAEPN